MMPYIFVGVVVALFVLSFVLAMFIDIPIGDGSSDDTVMICMLATCT